MATLSIIVATSCRPTLTDALASIASQIQSGDEIIVVANRDGDYGNRARNSGIDRARGSHIAFLDDDDVYLPGALGVMREHADREPDRVFLFQHRSPLGGPSGYPAAVGGAIFPNHLGKLGRFNPARPEVTKEPRRPDLTERAGDQEFMRSTLELRGDQAIRVPIPVCMARPEKSRWRRFRYQLRLRQRLQV